MRRYLRVWRAFFKNNLVREMEFREHFFLRFLIMTIWTLMNVATIELLFSRASTMVGWTKAEVFMIFGIYRIVAGLNHVLFSSNISRFSYLVNSGDFDFYLAKPLQPLFMVSSRYVSFSSLTYLLYGIAIVWYATVQSEFQWTVSLILFFLGFLLAGSLILLGVQLAIVTPVFWAQKLENIHELQLSLTTTARFPREIYQGLVRELFTFMIPIAFIAAIPAAVLYGKTPQFFFLLAWLVAGVLLALVSLFFRLGLKSYTSASS